MSKAALDTLFLPLGNGDIASTGKVLFLGAAYHPTLSHLKSCEFWQPFKPVADTLLGTGPLHPDIPSSGIYDLVLVHIPKQADEARFWLARALSLLSANGILLAAAGNDAGGARIKGWMEELGFDVQSLSKNKARAVWGRRPDTPNVKLADAWISQGSPRDFEIMDGFSFETQPGVFSWDRLDAGSRLLIENFPVTFSGTGADFGAGIGVLSHAVLSRGGGVSELHLVEADSRALGFAQKNLSALAGKTKIQGHWHDLSKPLDSVPVFDFIVMNPPFHQGSAHNIGIGRVFIENAAHHLKKGGMLYMVANTHLPYEEVLAHYFVSHQIRIQKDGFKVIEAKK
jgi:16S rRNA (guanine1207-N2)-methyltransferase